MAALRVLAAIACLSYSFGARIRPHVLHAHESRSQDSQRHSFDVSKDASWNAHRAFDRFEHEVSHSSYQIDAPEERMERFTKEEAALYRARVVEQLAHETTQKRIRSIANVNARDSAWTSMVQLSLQEQFPLMTQYEINELNKQNLGWVAGESEMIKDLTVGGSSGLLGMQLSDETREELDRQTNASEFLELSSDDQDSASLLEEKSSNPIWGMVQDGMAQLGLGQGRPAQQRHHHSRATTSTTTIYVPPSFLANEQWPQCSETFDHVRNQGSCGSCWAQAAASVMESRLCVRTNGAFTGWISAQYLTSCIAQAKGKGGCDGSDPVKAFQFAAEHGVPTGGQSTLLQTDPNSCVPYWNGGNPLKHMIKEASIFGGEVTPKCPSDCTSSRYPKSLKEDMHRLTMSYPLGRHGGINVYLQPTQAYNAAKISMSQHGPVVISFAVYRDFMAYTGGIYRRGEHHKPLGDMGGWGPKLENTHMGYHAVVGLGWTPEYFILKNSWGGSWGERGRFKMCSRQIFRRIAAYVQDLGVVSASRSHLPSLSRS